MHADERSSKLVAMTSLLHLNTQTYTWLAAVMTMIAIASSGSQLSTPIAIGPPTEEQFLSLLFQYMQTNLSSHRCNFDRPGLCAFRRSASSSGVWSFQRSVAEFADQMQQAARDAADAEARHGQVDNLTQQNKMGEPYSSFQPLHTFKVPPVNYFPCSTSPVTLVEVTQPPSSVSSITGGPSRSRALSTLELSLPWLQLVQMPMSLTPPEDATESSGYFARHRRAAPAIPTYPPLACLSVDFRFPSSGNGYFAVAFNSLIQSVRSDAPEKIPIPRATLPTRQPDSLLGTQTTTTSKISPLSHRLPANTWITFMAPVHIELSTQSANQSGLTFIADQHGIPITFHLGSNDSAQDTWMAIATRRSLLLDASQGVCIDNFRLFPFSNISHARTTGISDCQRQLQWLEMEDGFRSIVYLDASGNPLPVTEPPSQLTPLSLIPGSFLSAYDGNLSSGVSTASRLLSWIPFSGSLILALSATLLFLCLCLAISLSVMLARRRHHRPPRAPHRISGKRSSNGLVPYSPPPLLTAGSKLNWIASNSLFGTDEHFSTLGSGSQSMPQCELSLPLNELLISPAGEGGDNTERTSVTNPSLQLSIAPEQQPLNETVDPAITSAWQFMRNLRFHRRKGGRLLKQLDARSRVTVSKPQPPSLHYEIPRRPVPIYRRPAMNLNLPPMVISTLDICNQSAPLISADHQPVNVSRRTRGNVSVTSATPYRHSLMLSVNQDNELVIRPMEPAVESVNVMGNTGSLPCGTSLASRHQEHDFHRLTSDTSGTVSHDQQTTPSTVARSMLPSDGSGPPSYADSSEAG